MQRSENESVPQVGAGTENAVAESAEAVGKETETRRDRLEELSVQVSELELRLGKMEAGKHEPPVLLPGPVSGSPAPGLTPDDVRGMDAEEVRKNYLRILESMKNWH